MPNRVYSTNQKLVEGKKMGLNFKCENCGNAIRIRSDEIERYNIGTQWAIKLRIPCGHCEKEINSTLEPWSLFDSFFDPKLSFRMVDDDDREIPDSNEYLFQEYVAENAIKLLGSKIKKINSFGPDLVTEKGDLAEVEFTYKNYLRHGHHQDKNFRDVKYLIVLKDDRPPKKVRNLLPPNIIYVDAQEWEAWKKKRSYVQFIYQAIAGEFKRRYRVACPDRERDMATCPSCSICAYLSEDVNFLAMATQFILYNKIRINDSFKLTSIKPELVDYCFPL